ncbi:hypothetical protein MBLNU230_g8623t1 [Neophaeotheca triangularis]
MLPRWVQQHRANDQWRDRVCVHLQGWQSNFPRQQRSLQGRLDHDNYAYFAMSMWMEQRLGMYPRYLSMCDPKLLRAENQARENTQPSAQLLVQSWELEDTRPDSDGTVNDSDVVYSDILPLPNYPTWYWPALNVSAATIPDILVPGTAVRQVYVPAPGTTTCEISSGSPSIDDCMHAFGPSNKSPTQRVPHGEQGGTWSAGHSLNCALEVYYTEDCPSSCTSTLGDVAVHAGNVFYSCQESRMGKVGGYLALNVRDCPAYVRFVNTGVETL